jgi:hypothetical protein
MNAKNIKWTAQKKSINDLKLHEKNPRIFTEKGMKDLENSIKSVGFFQPIVINLDGTILSGHARYLKLKEMGETEIEVMLPDRNLTEKQEEEILVRANANTAGKWDFDILENQFNDFELTEWGLEVPSMENLPDLSILDEEDQDQKLEEMQYGVKKGILIEFDKDLFDEAYELIKFWKGKELDIGKYLFDKLKAEKEKL